MRIESWGNILIFTDYFIIFNKQIYSLIMLLFELKKGFTAFQIDLGDLIASVKKDFLAYRFIFATKFLFFITSPILRKLCFISFSFKSRSSHDSFSEYFSQMGLVITTEKFSLDRSKFIQDVRNN